MRFARGTVVALTVLAVPVAAGCASSRSPRPAGGTTGAAPASTAVTSTRPAVTPTSPAVTPTSTGGTSTSSCSPSAGGRCPGPLYVPGSLTLGGHGRELTGVFLCGGSFRAVAQSASEVRVSYVASRVAPGALQCARVPLTIRLDAALGNRVVIDTFNGRHVPVIR